MCVKSPTLFPHWNNTSPVGFCTAHPGKYELHINMDNVFICVGLYPHTIPMGILNDRIPFNLIDTNSQCYYPAVGQHSYLYSASDSSFSQTNLYLLYGVIQTQVLCFLLLKDLCRTFYKVHALFSQLVNSQKFSRCTSERFCSKYTSRYDSHAEYKCD